MIIPTPTQPRGRKSHSQPEMKIQSECVLWLYNNRPETRGLFYHIRNEVDRPDANPMLIAKYRAEGLVKGVADCALMMARKSYHGLFVEFKTDTGRQSSAQKSWQQIIENQGYLYRVIRSLEEFKELINWYLAL